MEPITIDEKTFLRDHFALPALPAVITKIQRLIESGDADMSTLADLINSEPSLVAQVLKVANSAYYSLPREVKNVKFAIAFLGLNEIYRMVLSLAVVNTLAIDKKDVLSRFWSHSYYTALCTKYLAKKYEQHLSFEELWSAAILHDIGKLVYLKFFPDHYDEIVRLAAAEGATFSAIETRFSLPSSARFGSLLCDHWRLPAHIKIACENHTLSDFPNTTGEGPKDRFKRMICGGNLLAVLATEEDLHQNLKNKIAQAIKTSIGCTETEFLAIMGDIYDLRIEVERFTEQFN